MKKILILSYLFPPTSALDGAMRTLKFVKYLPHFGYKPYVITVKDAFLSKDETLLGDIPEEASILMVRQLDPRYLRRLFKHRNSLAEMGLSSRRQGLLRKLISLFAFPDSTVSWLWPAVISGLKKIKSDKIDIILATAPPYSDFIAGYLLKRLTGKPLIMDYRDLQMLSKRTSKIDLFGRWKKAIEKKIIKYSDAVITTSESSKETLIKACGIAADKFHVVTNGFDSDDFVSSAKRVDDGFFRIHYSGYLYGKRAPFGFFDIIESLISRNAFSHNVKIRITGRVETEVLDSNSFSSLLKNNNLIIENMLVYKDSISALGEADIFLLTSDSDIPGMLPAKLFEYLALNKPILALAPESSATLDFVNKYSLGVAVEFSDKKKIEEAILKLYRLVKVDKLKITHEPGFKEQFERKDLTKKLVGIADTLIASTRGNK